ncbi:MAG: proline--tRNA ligase [Hadesarchaea archaeon YNP_N21]|jgi:prolyl-tRNA synthetase|nr:MAG: proline--tRNA ligase [Hadesarchaea archaeon YNP_N21]
MWRSNIGEWFNDILFNAGIMDTRYPVKGLYVWLPYGLKLRNLIFGILRKLLEEHGHQEVLFPLLIPEDILRKETEHITGFESQVYWVTHGGYEKLDVKLALRPTSETSIYPMFERWIRSHADLPIKIFQVVNIFRYETKMTKPMIRMREVTTFKEAHTAHATEDEAELQVQEAVKIYKNFFDQLGIPYIIAKRPRWDTFAGAKYSIAFDTIMPDGKTLQIGTVHNLGQNFAKVFELKFEKSDGNHEYVYQTCYGISDRAVASVIITHGDDLGLCLPPEVSPIQVVIVPIPFKGEEGTIQEFAKNVLSELLAMGIRAHLDDRDIRPGEKFYYWERRGVPLRVEIGPEEVKDKSLTIARRDTGERELIALEGLETRIRQLLEGVNKNLCRRSREFFEGMISNANNLEEIKRYLNEKGGIVRAPWCGREECGMYIEQQTGAGVLGQEINSKPITGKCPVCSRESSLTLLIAKSY